MNKPVENGLELRSRIVTSRQSAGYLPCGKARFTGLRRYQLLSTASCPQRDLGSCIDYSKTIIGLGSHFTILIILVLRKKVRP
jgi:hypothetical protein